MMVHIKKEGWKLSLICKFMELVDGYQVNLHVIMCFSILDVLTDIFFCIEQGWIIGVSPGIGKQPLRCSCGLDICFCPISWKVEGRC